MLKRLFGALARLVGRPEPVITLPRYSLRVFGDRGSATEAAKNQYAAAVIRSHGIDKWCLFTCPCGCGQQIALNLMKSHFPRWRVDTKRDGTFSLYPSVDSTTCGAHFLIRNSQVVWCEGRS